MRRCLSKRPTGFVDATAVEVPPSAYLLPCLRRGALWYDNIVNKMLPKLHGDLLAIRHHDHCYYCYKSRACKRYDYNQI